MVNVIQMRSLVSQNADAALDSTCSTDIAQVCSDFLFPKKTNLQTTDTFISFFHTFLFPYLSIVDCACLGVDLLCQILLQTLFFFLSVDRLLSSA